MMQKFLSRFNRHEISGSLGDLGAFIPLLVGMSITNRLDFTSALFFSGVFNLVTGFVFCMPMAVQPMKAIAAVAISEHLPLGQILAAGIWTSLIILILGLSGLITVATRIIPKPVIRGLQLGLGLQLLIKGIQLVRDTRVLWGLNSISIGVHGACRCDYHARNRGGDLGSGQHGDGICAGLDPRSPGRVE
jgi:hypothetical protein